MSFRRGAAVTAIGVTTAALCGLRRLSTGAAWTRRNYRDRPVHLAAGPAATFGAAASAAVSGAPARACAAVLVAGGLGWYDDIAGASHARGLRGHGRALARGEVTTGLVKLVGLVGAGYLAAPARGGRSGIVARMADAALIAGSANLVNLLDLRPGRALKAVTLTAAPLAVGSGPAAGVATGVVATAATLLPGDLGERHMIGDCGANALGASVGWVLANRLGSAGRSAALATVVALTLVSEVSSFSALIDKQPALSAMDSWGRLPA